MKTKLSLLFVASLFGSFLAAGPSQVEFFGEVTAVSVTSPDTGTVTVQVTPTVELTVLVTGFTEIRDGSDPIDLEDLAVGSLVKVEGMFTGSGILASELVVVSDGGATVEIRGRIDATDAATRTLEIEGFVIFVPETAEIKKDGEDIPFEDIEVNDLARVEANVVGGVIEATEVRISSPADAFARISIEGIVVSLTDSSMEVLVEGLTDPVPVVFADNVQIRGELAIGVLVRVVGRLTPDLTIEAFKIFVRRLLQLAPSKLNLRIGQVHPVEVVFRNSVDADVEVSLSSEDPAVAVPTTDSILISAGKQTGSFRVEAVGVGTTQIRVSLPADLGGLEVLLPVAVRGADKAPQKLSWRPAQLSMETEDDEDAKLILRNTADTPLPVAITQIAGPAGLVTFPASVEFPAGEDKIEVEFLSGPSEGRVTLRATLPTGETADIRIRVRQD